VMLCHWASGYPHSKKLQCLQKIKNCSASDQYTLKKVSEVTWKNNCIMQIYDIMWKEIIYLFLISNFRCVLNNLCFHLGNSLASEFYVPMFRNTLFHLHAYPPMKMGQGVAKCWHIKFRRRGITRKKAYINYLVFFLQLKFLLMVQTFIHEHNNGALE
jgi:hypothetical protein